MTHSGSVSPTEDSPPPTGLGENSWRARLFGSVEYFWLWIAQVVTAFGDWVGFFAITALAATISKAPEAATALVLTARVAPSFVCGPVMGMLVDRFDRKRLMRIADLGRALVFLLLPFVDSVMGLILASLVLEILTLLWSPAKEALVPLIVPRERLTSANSLAILAAYGTMPLAGLAQFGLKELNDQVSGAGWLRWGGAAGETQLLAFYFDAASFLVTALLVWRCVRTPSRPTVKAPDQERAAVASPLRSAVGEIREGWRFVLRTPTVRGVNIGLGAGLLGGAMLVPLGPTFAREVIGDSNAFSLYITALGCGVALGVGALTALQDRINKERCFVLALGLSGVSLLIGVSMSTFWLSAGGVFGLGLGAGSVYVLGFTLLQEGTSDELRGRTFSTLLSNVRLCVLGAMVAGPGIAAGLGPLLKMGSGHGATVDYPTVTVLGLDYPIPPVRVTLWIASVVIILATLLSANSIIGGRALDSVVASDKAEPHDPNHPL